jgi:predicted acetyltransferase
MHVHRPWLLVTNFSTVPGLPLVPVDPQDTEALTAWATTVSAVFMGPRPTPESIAARQERMAGHRLFAAMDRGSTVATFRSFDSHLTLPTLDDDAIPLPVNAISSVTVLPTHRRRRLLSRWMTQDLERARRSGTAASILIASEAPIYRRFGFGVAATACTWTVNASSAAWRRPAKGTVEIVSPEMFAEVAPAVYERARRRQPGAIDRTEHRWRMVAQLSADTEDYDRHRLFAVHRAADGEIDGLLVYRPEAHYEDGVPASTLKVLDLVWVDDDAYADLWRFCTEVDWVAKVVAEDRSLHEPLPLLLADPRTARNGYVNDFLWVRLHDVPTALCARRYAVPGRLVLAVDDDLGQVPGRYVLDVDGEGRAQCTTAQSLPDADVDATLDVATLGELWLGSGNAGALARAGRLQVRDAATLARVDAVLGWHEPAWCGTWF